jgi:hypothetical protein
MYKTGLKRYLGILMSKSATKVDAFKALVQVLSFYHATRMCKRPLRKALMLSFLPCSLLTTLKSPAFDAEYLANWLNCLPKGRKDHLLRTLVCSSTGSNAILNIFQLSLGILGIVGKIVIEYDTECHFSVAALSKRYDCLNGHIISRKLGLSDDHVETVFPGIYFTTKPSSPRSLHSRVRELLARFEPHVPKTIKEASKYGYFLASNVGRYEYADPNKALGTVQGQPYFRPDTIVKLKSKDAWLTQFGRVIKAEQPPLKVISLKTKSGNKNQELFSIEQTELYIPPEFSRCQSLQANKYRNINIFTPSMIPKNAAWVRELNARELSQALDIPYVEVCTGFTFRRGKATPDMDGVLVHVDDFPKLSRAFKDFSDFQRKQSALRQDAFLRSLWNKILNSVDIKCRLAYEDSIDLGDVPNTAGPLANEGHVGNFEDL